MGHGLGVFVLFGGVEQALGFLLGAVEGVALGGGGGGRAKGEQGGE
jgi:hypothetical protein